MLTESRYPARVRTIPERLIDIQSTLSMGKYHGKYVRKHIQDENINKNALSKLSGYISDGGFVVEDEIVDALHDDDSDDESCVSDSEDDEDEDIDLETDTE